MSGNGTLFSWAVVYHAWVPQLRSFQPYATGLVALQEDPHVRVATMLVDVDVLQLVPDMPVEAVFRPLSFPPSEASVMAPFFRPIPRYG